MQFADAAVDPRLRLTERRADDRGGLDRPRHLGCVERPDRPELAFLQPRGERLCLRSAPVGEASARIVAGEVAAGLRRRLAVAHEHEAGGSHAQILRALTEHPRNGFRTYRYHPGA